MIIYGNKIEVLDIDPIAQTARCRISMVEIAGRDMDRAAMLAMLSPEEQHKLSKEWARQKVKAEKNNPSMATGSGSKSKYGGYMIPFETTLSLEEVLTGPEKAEIRNMKRRHRKGHFGAMLFHYGTDSLNEALARLCAKVKKTPRITVINGVDPAGCLQKELVTTK